MMRRCRGKKKRQCRWFGNDAKPKPKYRLTLYSGYGTGKNKGNRYISIAKYKGSATETAI
jgi:hypothetical protein